MATYSGSLAQLCCGEGGILLACMSGWTTQGLPQLMVGVHLPGPIHLGSEVHCEVTVPGRP